jgi:hypothetical protein
MFLAQYHQRSNSESGFATDKKMLGWSIAQRREDRTDNLPDNPGIDTVIGYERRPTGFTPAKPDVIAILL